ncbi:stage VI sporulation protein F [Brevibacillus humidisoli]|uniref:stage VI sporulation protein F n=1 Tax=Brevibacillus humidisoli TaxID=2895522 RepID=UPI001E34FD36|nr:stage VI sporulation protein F [Brevibacillus humidisoli]UFJ42799.1 stage VI sporulation protein F [Brevibacillus humidisoli]
MENNVSRRLLDKLQGKVDEGQIRSIASGLTMQDFSDEDKLRKLIKMIAGLSGTAISQEKEDRIVGLIREKQINPNDLQSLAKLLK